MRRAAVATLLVSAVAAALLVALAEPEWLDAVGLGGDRGKLRELTHSFFEDLRFKDFARAASYHAPEVRDQVDIPYLLWRIFLVKPELLDIMEDEVLGVDIDSTGLRARVRANVTFKDLLQGKVRKREVILYFHRASPDDPWYMKLESSLREIKPEPGKAH